MHHLKTLSQTVIELHWHPAVSGNPAPRARQLRGAIAGLHPDQPLFHQRDGEGRQLYRYPLIHYRWHRGAGVVVGWGEAAHLLSDLPWLDLTLSLGEERVRIHDAYIACRSGAFYASQRLHHYHLVTPALLFNQDNYRRYQRMDPEEQQRERDRLLTAHLLTAMRGLDVSFPDRLLTTFTHIAPHPSRYKGQTLLGLGGSFVCNAELPPGFAIGHAVSHGYGWIEPRKPLSGSKGSGEEDMPPPRDTPE